MTTPASRWRPRQEVQSLRRERTVWVGVCSKLRGLSQTQSATTSTTPSTTLEAVLGAQLDCLEQLNLPNSSLSSKDAGQVVWALCRACPPEVEFLSARVAQSVVDMYEKQRQVSLAPAEADDVADFLVQSLSSPRGTLMAHQVIRALAQVAYVHGEVLSRHPEMIRRISLALLTFADPCAPELDSRRAALDGLSNLFASTLGDFPEEMKGEVCECLRQNFNTHWRGSIVEEEGLSFHITASSARGLGLALKAGCARFLEPYVGALALGLNHTVQPRTAGSTTSPNCLMQSLTLLQGLSAYASTSLLPHWGLFIPSGAEFLADVGGHRPSKPRRKCTVLPGGLLAVLALESSPLARCSAADTASLFVKNAPLKRLLGTAGLEHAPQGGLGGRIHLMIRSLHTALCTCMSRETVPSVRASLFDCAGDMLSSLSYSSAITRKPMTLPSFDAMLLDILRCASAQLARRKTGADDSAAIRLLSVALSSEVQPGVACEVFVSEFTPTLVEWISLETDVTSELLGLLGRIGRHFPHCLLSSNNWPSVSMLLKHCFQSAEQNVRLHGLKAFEETLRARHAAGAAAPPVEWSAMLELHLERALHDPYHGVRSVAAACHCWLVAADWASMDKGTRERRLGSFALILDDPNASVSTSACRAVSALCVLAGEAATASWVWEEGGSGMKDMASRDARQSVASQAMVGVSSLTCALRLCQLGEMLPWELIADLCDTALEGLSRNDKSSHSAARALGFLTTLLSIHKATSAALQVTPQRIVTCLTQAAGERNTEENTRRNCCVALGVILAEPACASAVDLQCVTFCLCGMLRPSPAVLCHEGGSKSVASFIMTCTRAARALLDGPSMEALGHVAGVAEIFDSVVAAQCLWGAPGGDTHRARECRSLLFQAVLHTCVVTSLHSCTPSLIEKDFWDDLNLHALDGVLNMVVEILRGSERLPLDLSMKWSAWVESPCWRAHLDEMIFAFLASLPKHTCHTEVVGPDVELSPLHAAAVACFGSYLLRRKGGTDESLLAEFCALAWTRLRCKRDANNYNLDDDEM